MNYQEAKKYVKQIQQGAAIKPGLNTIKQLLGYLENPQDTLKVVHIVGTNGKGSTGAFLESVLAHAGMKVGRFASPAVFHERESIRYRQKATATYISEEEYVACVEKIQGAIDKMTVMGERVPTEFEIETAMAFLMFRQWKCNIVLMEAGMGGRLDSTNVVNEPVCVVITPIAKDHTRFLGKTIQEIAMEKAGVIKKGTTVVTYQEKESAKKCIEQTCREMGCNLYTVEEQGWNIHENTMDKILFSYRTYDNINITMYGEYQVNNACLALECISVLKKQYGILENDIRQGMKQAKWPGRFERIHMTPDVVIDGAHNPAGVKAFCKSAKRYYNSGKCIGIMGVFADKDYKMMCSELREVLDEVYVVTPPSERGLPAKLLAEAWQEKGVQVICMKSVTSCLQKVMEEKETEEKKGEKSIFILGSLSILKEAKEFFD